MGEWQGHGISRSSELAPLSPTRTGPRCIGPSLRSSCPPSRTLRPWRRSPTPHGGWAKLDQCIAARERAYARFEAEGDARHAARSAILLYDYYCFKGRRAVANGWLQRAKRLLEDQPESPEHGVLLEREAEVANGSGALELALEKAGRAVDVGRRLRDADVEADALQCKGRLLITLGTPAEGLALFDEAMLLGAEGRLGQFVVGKVYCSLISACDEIGDLQRAAEWTEVGGEWATTQESTFYPGLCRLHRAELLKLKGAWAQAEAEARRACAELTELHVPNVGAAFYQVGGNRASRCCASPRAGSTSRRAASRLRSPSRHGTGWRERSSCRRRWRSQLPRVLSTWRVSPLTNWSSSRTRTRPRGCAA